MVDAIAGAGVHIVEPAVVDHAVYLRPVGDLCAAEIRADPQPDGYGSGCAPFQRRNGRGDDGQIAVGNPPVIFQRQACGQVVGHLYVSGPHIALVNYGDQEADQAARLEGAGRSGIADLFLEGKVEGLHRLLYGDGDIIVIIFLAALVAGRRIPVGQPLAVGRRFDLGIIGNAGTGISGVNGKGDLPGHGIARSNIGNEGVELGDAVGHRPVAVVEHQAGRNKIRNLDILGRHGAFIGYAYGKSNVAARREGPRVRHFLIEGQVEDGANRHGLAILVVLVHVLVAGS